MSPIRPGETPLIAAVHARNVPLVRLLLEKGADPDRNDNSGRSARDYMELMNGNTLLKQEFANADAKTRRGGNQEQITGLLSDMTDPDFADLTLDELRVALAPDIAASAIFDGWNETALVAAAEMAGCDVDVARLAFPGAKPMDMIEAWITSVDQAMEAEWPQPNGSPRSRSASASARWSPSGSNAVAHIDEAVRRALAVMAQPQNARARAEARLAFGGYHVAARG